MQSSDILKARQIKEITSMSKESTLDENIDQKNTTEGEDEDIPKEELLSDDERITVMLTALQSPQLMIRTTAVNQLVELGKKYPDKTIPVLIDALKDDYWSVRFGAAEALGEIGYSMAVPALIKYLENDDDPEFRAKVAEQLGLIGDKQAVPALIKALQNDPSELVREFACKALGLIADDRAEPALREALKDQHDLVRREAANALGMIAKKESVEALIEALTDRDPKVRALAATALGHINDPSAILPLIETLKDGNVEVHEAAKNALERFEATTIFQIVNESHDGDIYQTLGKIREAALSIGDEGVLMQLYKEKATPIVEPLREKARTLLQKIQKTNEQGREYFRKFKPMAQRIDKLASASHEELVTAKDEIENITQELKELQKAVQKDLDFLAEVSLYEFKKHEWVKSELFFDLQAIEREIDDCGSRLRNLRELIENKKSIATSLKNKIG